MSKKNVYRCPECQKEILINPARLLGQRTSPAKKAAAKANANIRWKKYRAGQTTVQPDGQSN